VVTGVTVGGVAAADVPTDEADAEHAADLALLAGFGARFGKRLKAPRVRPGSAARATAMSESAAEADLGEWNEARPEEPGAEDQAHERALRRSVHADRTRLGTERFPITVVALYLLISGCSKNAASANQN
jgi:hypothetical protein